jgi:hypothetical protein
MSTRWQCAVCEVSNDGGDSCSVCGATVVQTTTRVPPVPRRRPASHRSRSATTPVFRFVSCQSVRPRARLPTQLGVTSMTTSWSMIRPLPTSATPSSKATRRGPGPGLRLLSADQPWIAGPPHRCRHAPCQPGHRSAVGRLRAALDRYRLATSAPLRAQRRPGPGAGRRRACRSPRRLAEGGRVAAGGRAGQLLWLSGRGRAGRAPSRPGPRPGPGRPDHGPSSPHGTTPGPALAPRHHPRGPLAAADPAPRRAPAPDGPCPAALVRLVHRRSRPRSHQRADPPALVGRASHRRRCSSSRWPSSSGWCSGSQWPAPGRISNR